MQEAQRLRSWKEASWGGLSAYHRACSQVTKGMRYWSNRVVRKRLSFGEADGYGSKRGPFSRDGEGNCQPYLQSCEVERMIERHRRSLLTKARVEEREREAEETARTRQREGVREKGPIA